MAEEEDEDCTHHDDVSPAFSKFERPSSKSLTDPTREFNSDSTTDFGLADPTSHLGFGSTDRGGSADLARSHSLGLVARGLSFRPAGPTLLAGSGSKGIDQNGIDRPFHLVRSAAA